jgi:hypothetical protein
LHESRQRPEWNEIPDSIHSSGLFGRDWPDSRPRHSAAWGRSVAGGRGTPRYVVSSFRVGVSCRNRSVFAPRGSLLLRA